MAAMLTEQFSRFLAGSDGSNHESSYGEDDEHFGVHVHYSDIYASIAFLAAIYASGNLAVRIFGMPSLVGEIFCGIIMGPNLLDFVPSEESFVMLGEIG